MFRLEVNLWFRLNCLRLASLLYYSSKSQRQRDQSSWSCTESTTGFYSISARVTHSFPLLNPPASPLVKEWRQKEPERWTMSLVLLMAIGRKIVVQLPRGKGSLATETKFQPRDQQNQVTQILKVLRETKQGWVEIWTWILTSTSDLQPQLV